MVDNPAVAEARREERNREIQAELIRERNAAMQQAQIAAQSAVQVQQSPQIVVVQQPQYPLYYPTPSVSWTTQAQSSGWQTQTGSNNMAGFSFPSFNSIVTTLQAAGLTGTTLTSAVTSLVANSPTTAIQTLCQTVLQNSANPTVVKDCCVKMAEIPNLPIAVANLIPSLAAAENPMQVTQAVQAIEGAANPNGGGFGFHIGGF